MSTGRGDVDAAIAGLRARWGAAAPRVVGALALAPSLEPAPDEPSEGEPLAPTDHDRVIRTGFAALDAILGPGGLPTSASVAIRGDGSSGRTTLTLRVAAEAQAQGSVVAWLDLSRSFDPVEAVARGVQLEWLVLIVPATLDEGLSIAGSLLAGRSVDLLVLDLPGGRLAPTDRPSTIADRLHRLAALARRAETLLLILETPGLAGGLATAVAESTGIRLELVRRSWVRLGRDVVGQRTEALIARNRHGPPGRSAVLRILYADGGERDACLARDALLIDQALATPRKAPIPEAPIYETPTHEAPDREIHHATPPSPGPASDPPSRSGSPLRALPDRSARPGRAAVGSGKGHRREPGRPGPRRPARHAAGERPSARS